MSAEATRLIVELIDVTKDWNTWDKTLPPGHADRVKAIGRALYALGGEELMVQAYDEAHAFNRAAAFVQALWDGIGEWRW